MGCRMETRGDDMPTSSRLAKFFSLALIIALACTSLEAQTIKTPSRFVPGDATIAPAANDQSSPELSQGGTTLLAVWADNRANSTGGYEGETSWDIYGVRIDESGNPLEAVPFAIASGPASQRNPRASWNGSAWLVVFESVDFSGTGSYYQASLEALRVGPDGDVLDPKPIKIYNDTPVGATWSVASDDLGWVIVNQGTSVTGDLVASRISAQGALLDPGPRSLVEGTYYMRGNVRLAHAGGVFLLAYEESMTGSSPTNAVRFDSGLNVLDETPIGLAPTPLARLVSNGSEFYAVWNEQLPDFTTAVMGTRIATGGQKLDGAGDNISGPNPPGAYTTTSVAWDGSQWKVTWASSTEMRIATVSATGQVINPGGIAIPGAEAGVSASAGNGSVQLARQEFVAANNNSDVLTNHIDASDVATAEHTLSIGAPSQLRVDLASGSSSTMMVYRSRTASRIRILAQPLNASGDPMTPEPVELESTEGNSYPGYPAVAWNGSFYMVAWNNADGVVAKRIQPDGTPVDAAPIQVMNPGFGSVDVEALGDDFLVVGLRCGINCQYVFPIAARVGGTDGVVLDATPIQMGGVFSSGPRLAVLDGRWLIVWRANVTHDDCLASTLGTFIDATGAKTPDFQVHGYYSSCGGNGIFTIGLGSSGSAALMVQSQELTSGVETDLLGRFIDPDGTVHPYVNLTPWKDDQYRPQVAWDGSQFVVVWQDQKTDLGGDWSLEQLDARSDLMGMRISPGGIVIDPQGFVVSNSPLGEAYPNVTASAGRTLIAGSVVRNEAPVINYRVGYEIVDSSEGSWPVAVASADPTGGDVPLSVSFSSAGTLDPDGTIAAFLWDFGDGEVSTESDPTHTYTVGGPHVATLTVTDGDGKQTTQELLVNALEPNLPPVAVASSDITSGPAPLAVIFSADGTYDPDGFVGNLQWSFSDGGTYYGSNAYHTFYQEGTHQATVTAFDGRGGSTISTPVIVTVTPAPEPPVASNVPSVLNGAAPLTVSFDGGGSYDPDGTVVSWSWVFGDGVTASGPVVSHKYNASGYFNVLLTVNDDQGKSQTSQVTIHVMSGGPSAYATGDAGTALGRIFFGSYLDTQSQNSVAEILEESQTGGSPQSRKSQLEHTWSLTVVPGGAQTFFVDAWHTANAEGDDFVFEYSRDNASWVPMVTVTKTTDDGMLQSYVFGEDVTGQLWVRVRDLDRTAGHAQQDRVYVEEMFVSSSASTGFCGEAGMASAPAGLLTLTPAPLGQVALTWGASCVATDNDYAVYRGRMGDFRSHVPVQCSTGGATNATIDLDAEDSYYLVVPNDSYQEGRYGRSGTGELIPAGPTSCYPAAPVSGCP